MSMFHVPFHMSHDPWPVSHNQSPITAESLQTDISYLKEGEFQTLKRGSKWQIFRKSSRIHMTCSSFINNHNIIKINILTKTLCPTKDCDLKLRIPNLCE